ncbi:DEAD/DEAH box helicase [Nocardioides daeguensis]|uniref:DEAD/DEAH box helicase n=1 Tax=Nocardioides daeguensis TaxID=908359 RepID=A0ABP6UTW3_9ACTN|nr:DEAD/DEAH box helicase [Nocardioides daeguensis]MBV6725847.1 DEAD/DEAH box helicase [Nocardioides daeguensis]MCR1772638.1 DEAD/DEAH box helicase [Nocardioides daeguensis]
MDVLAELTDDFLARHFDAGTLERARGIVAAGGVRRPEIGMRSAASVTATAEVLGSRATPYQVQLHVEAPTASYAGWVFTVCTCPVRSVCKHGAALALTLRQTFTQPSGEAAWRRSLERLVGELERQQPSLREEVPLALEFTLDRGRSSYRAAGPTLRVRPLRQGKSKPWIKSGAEWSDVGGSPLGFVERQADALAALHTQWAGHRGYHAAGVSPALDEFGDQVVRALRNARDAGVVLLAARPLVSVAVADEPAEVVAELDDVEGGTTMRAAVTLGGRTWRDDSVVLVGSPASVVGLLDDAGHLVVAATTAPVPPALRHLVDGPPILVPPADLADFRETLPGLMRLVPVRAETSALDLPEPLAPSLVLTVSWHTSTKAGLSWHWQYGDDPQRSCPLTSLESLGGVRDRAAEQALLATVPPGLLQVSTLTDGDALTLAIHDLPRLREIEGVRVVEEERPDFREADVAPEIRFDLVEPEASTTDWLDLAVTVRVDGEQIPLPDVLAALTLDLEFLVLPSGLYVTTDRPEFDRLREVVTAAAELRERDGNRIGIGHHDLGLWAQLAETGLVDAQVAEWVERAQALRDLTDIPRPEPRGLVTDLRSYQREGFWWLAFLWQHGLGGVLADDMGLGKTLQVLALITHARAERPDDAPFLVVAPTSVVTAWATETARHAPGLRVAVASRRTDDVAALARDHDVVVTTYTLLRLAHEEYGALAWSGLVLDEAQQAKNHQSKTYQAVRTISAPFRLAVTGTPFENRLMELWSLLSITVPGLYPWPRTFAEKVVRPVERDADQVVLDRFRARIKPFLLRRTKELVADDLPPKQEQVLEVDLGAAHRKIYDTHLAKERQRILGLVEDFDRNRVAIFSALTRLRQLALDAALVDDEHETVGSAKLDVLVEHLAEITAEGHRALVFSQFTSFLTRVRSRLDDAGIAATYLDGTTRDRAGVIDRFRSGVAPVFLISLKAGGTGLTLTEADYVFVLDPWWNPAAEAQAVDRAHRIGQSRHVHVYRLVATDTIEEKVMELKARKAELFAQVIDGDGAMSTSIGADDIRGLFE